MNNKKKGTVMQIVRIKTNLSEEEILTIAREREPQFKAIPGLVQKYYINPDAPGEYGGVYVWESRESLAEFRQSDLAATIAKAYEATEPPSIEIVDIMFSLR
jgi:heme-degrading monooxygenase HmoA